MTPRKTDVLTAASSALAAQIISVLGRARRWLAISGVSVLLVAFLLASPVVLGEYAQQILSQAFLFAIAAVTVDLLWGYTGILTFGQSAFFGIGVYTVAIALAYYVDGTLATAGAIIAAMVGAALVGAATGWLSFWDRASPIYVAIVTLALPVVFTQIILPNSRLALASVFILHFLFAWNDFYNPLIFTAGNENANVLSVGLNKFLQLHNAQTNLLMGASLLTMILPMVLFFLAQKTFMQGIVLTGVEK